MGLHAFEREPEHQALYRQTFSDQSFYLHGHREGWNVSACRHQHDFRDGVTFRGVPHYVLTYQDGGGTARRTDTDAPTARRGALSLQKPMSGGRFATSGEVKYWHLYFKQ